MAKYYIDQNTIRIAWDGAGAVPQLNHLLTKKKSHHEFYTSIINLALLQDELERTAPPKVVEAAEKAFRLLFVRMNAPVKLVSLHQPVSSRRCQWAKKARTHGYELSFNTAIELATAELTGATKYVTYIHDDKKLEALASFVKETTKQFEVIELDVIIYGTQGELYRGSTDDASESQRTASPNPGNDDDSAAHNKVDISGLLKRKRNPIQ